MSAIKQLQDALYGNPPSDNFKPSREGVIAAFQLLASTSTLTNLGIGTFSTSQEMNAAAPGSDDPRVAIVLNGDDAGIYKYVGSLPWVVFTEFFEALSIVVQPSVDKAEQAAVNAQTIVDGITSLLPAVLPKTYLFDPYNASATGSDQTTNATILMGKNYDEIGPVGAGAFAYIKRIKVFSSSNVNGITWKDVIHRRADQKVDWVRDLFTGNIKAGVTYFNAGVDFGFVPALAGHTLAFFSPADGIYRNNANDDPQGLPYVTENINGQNISLTYIAAHLMISVELGYADQSSKKLLYTFVSDDPGVQGTADFDGYFRVVSGTDGVTFPTQEYGEIIGKPAEYSVRDCNILLDTVTQRPLRMIASSHFSTLAGGNDNFMLARPKDEKLIDWIYMKQIQSQIQGCVGLWAPDFLPYDRKRLPELIVTASIPNPSDTSKIIQVPWLFRATSVRIDDFAPVQRLIVQGAGAPDNFIDMNAMQLSDGSWIAVAAAFNSTTNDEFLFFMTASDRLGPWTYQPRGGTVFGVEGNEAPQLKQLRNGAIRLIYDRFRDYTGLHYIDSFDLFQTHTSPALITTGPFINYAGETVSYQTRHGDIPFYE